MFQCEELLLPLVAFAFVLAGSVRADDAAKKIVDKAIAAHGGADLLAKNKDKATISKAKMTIDVAGGIEGTMESFIGDKKFKHIVEGTVMGMKFNQIVCYDGKEMWVTFNGKIVVTKTGKDLDPIKEAIYSEEMAGLVLLNDKDLELAVIGDSKIGENEVVGIRVSKKDHKDVSLFFDKKTGLLTKIDSRNVDFESNQEVAEEKLMHDYKKIDGMMRPTRVVVNRNDKKYIEMEFTEQKQVDKLDDGTFDKP